MIEQAKDIYFLDTNILVYAYDKDEGLKHEKAKKLLTKCLHKRIKLAVSPQVFSEFFVVVTKKIKKPMSIKDAQKIMNDIVEFSHFLKCNFNYSAVLEATSFCEKYTSGYYDALIAATMKMNGITKIYSEDTKHFSKIHGIQVVNPFKN